MLEMLFLKKKLETDEEKLFLYVSNQNTGFSNWSCDQVMCAITHWQWATPYKHFPW